MRCQAFAPRSPYYQTLGCRINKAVCLEFIWSRSRANNESTRVVIALSEKKPNKKPSKEVNGIQAVQKRHQIPSVVKVLKLCFTMRERSEALWIQILTHPKHSQCELNRWFKDSNPPSLVCLLRFVCLSSPPFHSLVVKRVRPLSCSLLESLSLPGIDTLPFHPQCAQSGSAPQLTSWPWNSRNQSYICPQSNSKSPQRQRRHAAIYNSCLSLLKASRHEKRGIVERLRQPRWEFECERGNGTCSFLAGCLSRVIDICSLYTDSLNILTGSFFFFFFSRSFSTIVSEPPWNLLPAFFALIKLVLFDISSHINNNRILTH